MTTQYFNVVGYIEGKKEVLFGSFDRNDCKQELDVEKSNWKSDGYKKLTIEVTETTETPDSEVYPNLVSKDELQAFIDVNQSNGFLNDYINDNLIVECGDEFLINDEQLLTEINTFKTGLITSHQLWVQQAPSFNFELGEVELLKKALDVGFVTQPDKSIALYKINEAY